MPISRRTWLFGGFSLTAAGLTALSLPGGGPRTFLGGAAPPQNLAPAGTLFSSHEQRAELSWLVDTMREVGANPFAYCRQELFDRLYAETIGKCDRPLDARGFFLSAAPLFAALNDGHVGLNLGFAFQQWGHGGGKMFPLLVTFDGDEMYVDTQTDEGLTSGTQIESIDGVLAAEIIKSLVALQGGQTQPLRSALAPALICRYFTTRAMVSEPRLR